MQLIFQYDNATNVLELNIPELFLIKEFSDLLDDKRNICKQDPKGKNKLRAFREFQYIWLAIDWKSLYSDYSELEKHELSLKDSGLTEEEFNDPLFRAACRKYRNMQEQTRSIKILKAAQNTVDKFTNYFNNVDPEERDIVTGKPIYKVKEIMTEMSLLSKVLEELQILEGLVKKEIAETSQIRGGAEDGFLPNI